MRSPCHRYDFSPSVAGEAQTQTSEWPIVQSSSHKDKAMKRFLVTLAVASVVAGPALSADMYVKAPVPSYNWTGCYVGGNVGGAWERADNILTVTDATPGYFFPAAIPGVNATGTASLPSGAFTGGGQGGCNWQSGQLVWGAEIDFESLSQSSKYGGQFHYTTNGAPYFLNESRSTNWLFTARPRVGFTPFNRVLWFFTGGLAVTNAKFTQTFSEPPFTPIPEVATLSSTSVGCYRHRRRVCVCRQLVAQGRVFILSVFLE
jgi:outer membrane immunogenic protein